MCALRHAPLLSLRAGEARPGSGEATPRSGLGRAPAAAGAHGPGPEAGQQQQVPGSRSGPGVRALGAASPSPSAPLPTYPAAGSCERVSGLGCPVHLSRRRPGVRAGRGALWRARGEARPQLGDLASAPRGGRLRLLSESLSHACERCSCRGGSGAGLGAIIWEDAVPCPAGAVVSPLKKPAPHCSWAAAAGRRGRPARCGEDGTVAPAPDCCRPQVLLGGRTRGLKEGRDPADARRQAAVRAGGAGIDNEHSLCLGPTVSPVIGPPDSRQSDLSAQPPEPARDCQLLRDQNRSVVHLVTQVREHPPETSIPSSFVMHLQLVLLPL